MIASEVLEGSYIKVDEDNDALTTSFEVPVSTGVSAE
jgi:hypothetical protein